jgi:hypothetical protein
MYILLYGEETWRTTKDKGIFQTPVSRASLTHGGVKELQIEN